MADVSCGKFRILSLDGGGAKGFYTLGVLHEVEAQAGRRLYEVFDLIYGTSTGSIIGAMLALGMSVEEIHRLYEEHVPKVMKPWLPGTKTAKLAALANTIFEDTKFEAVKTGVGVVATNWLNEKPMIFKSDAGQAHGRVATFVPGFGCTIADAVQASCSAYPFFKRKMVTTSSGDLIELGDGGFCANNPALYAVADATRAFKISETNIALLSIGVGVYPTPKSHFWNFGWWLGKLPSVKLLQKTLEINTQSMAQLHAVLFGKISSIRINQTFSQPEMATDLLEHDLVKLNKLRQRGRESFASFEHEISELLR
ncbi:patatin-like phospholipase family protein [Methylobacterium sp. WL116]|uniref:patatin-like phospholipase family protein n=1 Tax=Methylobacterium sp. WL116 TaxID=2603889 RepID=UPI0011CB6D0D|nr:patatin-like phospholipase family protein [Methylobacterium sp. WL116]TXM95368.1 patatin-like phospholipase family protein [Methylobacterium sp. WL116]